MDTFEAFADPIRRDLTMAAAEAPASAGELAARHQGISRPAVSRHLRVLVETGVLRADRDGRRRVFQLAPGAFAEVRAFLDATAASPAARLVDALDTEVARTRRDRRRDADATTDHQRSPDRPDEEQSA